MNEKPLDVMTLRGVHFLCTSLSAPSKQELVYPSLQFRIYEYHRKVNQNVSKEATKRYALGMASSIFKGARLNGSFESESRCDLIVAISTTARDDGKVTGSFMTVYSRASTVHPVLVKLGITSIEV